VKTTDLIGKTVAVTTTGPTGDDPFAISIANAGSIALPKPLELVSDNDGINVPLLPEIIEKNLKADINSFNEEISTFSQIDNRNLTVKYPSKVKDQIILDAVKDILQVNSASLEISENDHLRLFSIFET